MTTTAYGSEDRARPSRERLRETRGREGRGAGVFVALGWGRGGRRRWKQEVAAGARAGDTPLPTGRGG